MEAVLPNNEEKRLAILAKYHLFDSDIDSAYDDFTLIASQIAESPVALISLVDKERQWFKSKFGLDLKETSRASSFCAHAILDHNKPLVVEDATKDPRFMDNDLVTGNPQIRFYCGIPLVTFDEYPLGTLCVIDIKPRSISKEQRSALVALSRRVMNRFEIHRLLFELKDVSESQKDNIGHLTERLNVLLAEKFNQE